MSFFWPQRFNPESNTSVRLGRLLHWGAAAWALGWVVLSWIWAHNGWADAAPFGLGIAAVIYLGGRGLRYVLAGE